MQSVRVLDAEGSSPAAATNFPSLIKGSYRITMLGILLGV